MTHRQGIYKYQGGMVQQSMSGRIMTYRLYVRTDYMCVHIICAYILYYVHTYYIMCVPAICTYTVSSHRYIAVNLKQENVLSFQAKVKKYIHSQS